MCDLPVDAGDVRGAIEDSPAFNDALLASWAVYLRHYPEKTDSWKRLNAATMLQITQREFKELESAVRIVAFRQLNGQLKLLTGSQVKEALWEIDDAMAALVLLRARIALLEEERLTIQEEGYK